MSELASVPALVFNAEFVEVVFEEGEILRFVLLNFFGLGRLRRLAVIKIFDVDFVQIEGRALMGFRFLLLLSSGLEVGAYHFVLEGSGQRVEVQRNGPFVLPEVISVLIFETHLFPFPDDSGHNFRLAKMFELILEFTVSLAGEGLVGVSLCTAIRPI